MKQLACEMCGSTELIKQDGFFICQTCGTKYSVEEAKKMMVEGTVKVDETLKIKNYYELAENSYILNKPKAEEYCDRILELDSTNYRAWILKGKAIGWQFSRKEESFNEAALCFKKAIECAKDNTQEVVEEIEDELSSLFSASVKAICDDLKTYKLTESLQKIKIWLMEIQVAFTIVNNAYKLSNRVFYNVMELILCSIKKVYVGLMPHEMEFPNLTQLNELVNDYEKYFTYKTDDELRYVISTYGECVAFLEDMREVLSKYRLWAIESNAIIISIVLMTTVICAGSLEGWYLTEELRSRSINALVELYGDLRILDNKYIVPDLSKLPNRRETTQKQQEELQHQERNGGCYVATCVYGSYDCPQVWTLRRYRDDTLGSTWYGRLFIRTYYAISPTLVKWFGNTNWFKKLWKGKLDRMVTKLQSKGVEDTPYEDKKW